MSPLPCQIRIGGGRDEASGVVGGCRRREGGSRDGLALANPEEPGSSLVFSLLDSVDGVDDDDSEDEDEDDDDSYRTSTPANGDAGKKASRRTFSGASSKNKKEKPPRRMRTRTRTRERMERRKMENKGGGEWRMVFEALSSSFLDLLPYGVSFYNGGYDGFYILEEARRRR